MLTSLLPVTETSYPFSYLIQDITEYRPLCWGQKTHQRRLCCLTKEKAEDKGSANTFRLSPLG